MKRTKKLLSLVLSAVILSTAFLGFNKNAYAYDYAQELRDKGFPETYISQLVDLHSKHPNWQFEPFKTGLDWQKAVDGERSYHWKQLINNNVPSEFLCNCPTCYVNGNYVVREGSTWVAASENAVKYYMDPRTSLDEKYIFQFESTKFNSSATIGGIESILSPTWMYNSNITYKDKSGNENTFYLNGSPVKYSQAIYDAAKQNNLNAYYLSSKIVQEVGGKYPTAGGASGTYSGFEGIYNYYNIGANSGVRDGLLWASQNSTENRTNAGCNIRMQPYITANNSYGIVAMGTLVTINSTTEKQSDGHTWDCVTTTLENGESVTGYIRSDLINHAGGTDKYNRPWTNPYLSIINGANYIAEGFGKYQYTGYLQKFNVNKESGRLHSHEYMANVRAASSEALQTYNANLKNGTLDLNKVFYIPVFSNMPNDPSSMNTVTQSVTDLCITNIKSNSVSLSWATADTAKSYKINLYNESNGQSSYYTSTNNYITIDNLSKNSNMSVKVCAVNDYGDGVYSDAVSFKTCSLNDGWNNVDGNWYYSYGNSLATNGWVSVGGEWFFFEKDAKMAHDTMKMDSHGYCYLGSDGRMVKNQWAYTDKDWLYFDEDGYIATNRFVNDTYGLRYVDENGQIVYYSWKYDENGWFLLDANGYLTTNQWVADSHDWLYLGPDGRMIKNGWAKEADGDECFLGEDGYLTYNKFVNDGIGQAYVDENGVRVYNKWVSNNGVEIYIDDTGYTVVNTVVRDSKGLVYIDQNGKMTNNKWVYANGYGWVYVNSHGYLTTNSLKKDSCGWCYLDENGKMVVNRWILVPEGWIYFDNNGYMVFNTLAQDSVGTCYLNDKGIMVVDGWVIIDNNWARADEYGHLIKNATADDSAGTCYLDENGFMVYDRWIAVGPNWKYFDYNGYMVKNGYALDSVGWCYLGNDGSMLYSTWVLYNDYWNYIGSDGYLTTNSVANDSHGTCYLDANGCMTYNMWVLVNNKWMYFDNNGYLLKNSFIDDSHGTCYVDKNGYMVFDTTIDGKYIGKDGYLVK